MLCGRRYLPLPKALSSCYAKAIETKADMFTIMTFQILGSFWEKVVMPLVMTALSVGFSPRKVNDPKRRDAIANGQFILIKRTVYDAIGGHERVKDQIVEDKASREQVKWNGYRLIVADGMKVVRTRMYTSLPEMWEGWTKNIYLGLRDQPALLLLGVFGAFLAVVAALFLPVWPLLGLIWYLNAGGIAGNRHHHRIIDALGYIDLLPCAGGTGNEDFPVVCADHSTGRGDLRRDDVHLGVESDYAQRRHVEGTDV